MEHEKRTILGFRAIALLEIVLFLGAMLLLDWLAGPGNRFWNVCPHPFWIIVLLVTCQYGTAEGLAAAALSTCALLLFNLPPQTIAQNMYDYLYAVSRTPLLWVIFAVVLGELRYRHIRERDALANDLVAAQAREEKIAQAYSWVKEGKEKLEARIAGQLRSSVAAYQAARDMETLSPTRVLAGLESLVTAVMNPQRFSLYTLDDSGLVLSLSHGWQEDEAYQRRFASNSELYRAIMASRRVLCVANPEAEGTLAGQGVLAGPLVDRASGEIFGMLKIEALGFTELNLSSIETFAALCEWAGLALTNARKYQTAKDSSMVNPDHNLLTGHYFTRYADYITALGKRVGFDVSMIVVKLANAASLGTETRNEVGRALAAAVQVVLRSVDLAFDYQDNSEAFSVVLPTTDRRGAEVVAGKIRVALAERLIGPARAADVTFSLQTLHGK